MEWVKTISVFSAVRHVWISSAATYSRSSVTGSLFWEEGPPLDLGPAEKWWLEPVDRRATNYCTIMEWRLRYGCRSLGQAECEACCATAEWEDLRCLRWDPAFNSSTCKSRCSIFGTPAPEPSPDPRFPTDLRRYLEPGEVIPPGDKPAYIFNCRRAQELVDAYNDGIRIGNCQARLVISYQDGQVYCGVDIRCLPEPVPGPVPGH